MANGVDEFIPFVFSLVPLIVLIPIVGIIINLLFKNVLINKGAGIVASLAAGSAFLISILLFRGLNGHHDVVIVPLAKWISVGQLDLQWVFRVDTLSVTMMLAVTGVATLIHIYAIGYMYHDVKHNNDPERYNRFFVFFNLFIVAMMILISANNYLMLFVGWEGVGLCSYLLIGFWFEKGENGIANAKAAKKAFLVNRIGDFGLLIAIFILYWSFGTLSFDAIFKNAASVNESMPIAIMAVTLLMILGVAGKSAQLPLYVWLPDAMAGPTPVSALIHAATMVTAGIYLIARSAGLYELVPLSQNIVMWIGALTAIFAASVAVGQYDIKKVLAYSTISQLGFMVAAVGMGAYVAGMFHLVTHAFFKALLFLAAGSVILGLENNNEIHHNIAPYDPQDMRSMGALRKKMPITFIVYLVGALALSGIVPLAGFFSKDEILTAASNNSMVIYLLLSIAALLTAFYMGRQLIMIFYGKARSSAAKNASENSPIITIPLLLLALLSILGGSLNLPGIHSLEHWLSYSIANSEILEFNFTIALVSLFVAVFGLLMAWLIYNKNVFNDEKHFDPLEKILGILFTAIYNKWWIDELYNYVFVKPFYSICNILSGQIDSKVIDGFGNGLGSITKRASLIARKMQNGYIRSYALAIFFGLVVITTFIILIL